MSELVQRKENPACYTISSSHPAAGDCLTNFIQKSLLIFQRKWTVSHSGKSSFPLVLSLCFIYQQRENALQLIYQVSFPFSYSDPCRIETHSTTFSLNLANFLRRRPSSITCTEGICKRTWGEGFPRRRVEREGGTIGDPQWGYASLSLSGSACWNSLEQTGRKRALMRYTMAKSYIKLVEGYAYENICIARLDFVRVYVLPRILQNFFLQKAF